MATVSRRPLESGCRGGRQSRPKSEARLPDMVPNRNGLLRNPKIGTARRRISIGSIRQLAQFFGLFAIASLSIDSGRTGHAVEHAQQAEALHAVSHNGSRRPQVIARGAKNKLSSQPTGQLAVKQRDARVAKSCNLFPERGVKRIRIGRSLVESTFASTSAGGSTGAVCFACSALCAPTCSSTAATFSSFAAGGATASTPLLGVMTVSGSPVARAQRDGATIAHRAGFQRGVGVNPPEPLVEFADDFVGSSSFPGPTANFAQSPFEFGQRGALRQPRAVGELLFEKLNRREKVVRGSEGGGLSLAESTSARAASSTAFPNPFDQPSSGLERLAPRRRHGEGSLSSEELPRKPPSRDRAGSRPWRCGGAARESAERSSCPSD